MAFKRILLIDDESAVLFALKLLIETLGFEVLDFQDPAKALECLAKDSNFELILCDLRMSGLNGREVLKRVRESYPQIPLAIISGHARPEEVEQLLDEGACGFLSKPFTPGELQKLVGGLAMRAA